MLRSRGPEVPRSRAGNAIELPHARPGRIIGPHGAMGDLWHVPGTKDLRMGTKDHYRAWMAWMACNHRIHERFLQGFTGALICHDLHSEFSGLSWLKLKCIDPYKCTMVSPISRADFLSHSFESDCMAARIYLSFMQHMDRWWKMTWNKIIYIIYIVML